MSLQELGSLLFHHQNKHQLHIIEELEMKVVVILPEVAESHSSLSDLIIISYFYPCFFSVDYCKIIFSFSAPPSREYVKHDDGHVNESENGYDRVFDGLFPPSAIPDFSH